MVLSVSVDGWSAGTPLSALAGERQALLAVGMNGQPFPPEHGFPVRMIVPGLYGDVSATKWVTELKVTTFDADEGHWTPLGWSTADRSSCPPASTSPAPPPSPAGPVTVAGVAYAPHIGISAVEVRVDDKDWREAELAEVTGPDTWRQWEFPWLGYSGRAPAHRARHRRRRLRADRRDQPTRPQAAPPAGTGITVRVRES